MNAELMGAVWEGMSLLRPGGSREGAMPFPKIFFLHLLSKMACFGAVCMR